MIRPPCLRAAISTVRAHAHRATAFCCLTSSCATSMAKNAVLVLSLSTLQSVVVSMPRSGNNQAFDTANTLLGLTPEGRLCAVQLNRLSVNTAISIRVTSCTDHGHWDEEESIQVGESLPADVNVTNLRLRWFCYKSGTVFFTAVCGESGHRRSEVYALSLKTRAVEKLASQDGDIDHPWGNLHGYEMDQVAYLASLAEPNGLDDM